MPYIADFVKLCMAQRGDRYVFGAEASFSDPDPERFDCSELVQWALGRLDVPFVDGSFNQEQFCASRGTLISVERGIATFGALLFRTPGKPGHVAVSRGDGTTIEARGRAYGVNVFSASGRPWTHAARIPGISYGTPPKPPVPVAPKPATRKAPPFDHPHAIAGSKAIRSPHYDCEWVKRWQGQMRSRGWRIMVDGDYGPASREICEDFQREKELVVDGILGPQTWAATWSVPIR